MAVSKRTRFEVLRRDNFTCRYCRSKDNELHVDHVTPVSLGGSDKPDNLVAACKDCNAGKGSSAPDGEAVANVEDDAARWAAARARAVKAAAAARAEREAARKPFLDAWMSWDKDGSLLSPDWFDAVDRWLSLGITVEQVIEAMEITLPKRHVKHDQIFAYMGGIIRNWLRELDALTQAELIEQEVDGG